MARNTQTLRVSIVGDTRQLNQSLEGVQGRMQKFGGQMRDVGRTMTRRVTVPIVAMGAGILKTAGDFQTSMNRVGALTGETGSRFRKLEDQAKELGRTTQFSASEAAQGMGFLAQAGFDTDEILSAMPGTLQLAAAGQLDLAQAADIASNVLTGFGMEADEVGRVNDVLAYTAANANTDVAQLGEAMKYVAPLAASSGVSIEEAAAAIGALSDAGIQGSMAGTTLRQTIAALENPSAKASSALDKMGVSTHDAQGEMLPLVDIIAQLEDAGMGTAEAMEIFGARAGPGVAALVSQGSDALGDMTSGLEDAGGTAAEMADRQMEGLNGALARMRSALEGVALAIADSGLIDWAAGMAERLAGMFQRLAETNPTLLRLGVVIAGVAAAAGPLLWVGGALVSMLAGLLSPVALVVAAVAGLAAGLVYAYQKSEDFRDIVNGAFTAVRAVVGPTVDWLQDRLGAIGRWFGLTRQTVGEEVAEMSNEAVGEVVDMVGSMTDHISQLALDGESLTEDMAEKMIGNVRRIRDESIAAAEEQFTESREIYLGLADDLETITGEMTAGALREARTQRDESVQAAEEQARRVERHLQHLKDSGIEVTEAMRNNIVKAMEDQRDGAVLALADQEEQAVNVLSRLEAESGKITLKMAADAIKNSANQRDETIKAANQEYKDRVAAINQMQRESDDFTEEMARNAIREARGMRDETIDAANAQHDGVVGEISGMRSGVENEVDTMTGNVLSGWDRFQRDYLSKVVSFSGRVVRSFREDFLAPIRSVTDSVNRSFSEAWQQLQRNAASGVNSMIGILNGMIRGVNRVSSALGLGSLISEIGNVSWGSGGGGGGRSAGGLTEHHDGGIVGKDGKPTSGGLRPGERIIKALDGEEVLTEDDPRHIGHLGSGVSAHEVGGIASTVSRMASRVKDFAGDLATRVRGLISDTVRPSVERLLGSVSDTASQFGPVGRMSGAAVRKTGDAVLDWLSGVDSEAKDREVPDGPGNVQMGGSGTNAARLVAAFRSSGIPGRVTSVFRPGDPGLHGQRRAADFAGPTPSGTPTAAMGRIFDFFAQFGGLRELIYNGRPWNIIRGSRVPTSSLSAGLRRAHDNHVHAGMATGGTALEGGLSWVGENGRELAQVPTGARVSPEDPMTRLLEEQNQLLKRLLKAIQDGHDRPVNVDKRALVDVVMGEVAREVNLHSSRG